MKARAEWVQEIEAACSKRATAAERNSFADSVLNHLSSTAPHAMRVQGAREISDRIVAATRSAREGIKELRIRIERDPVSASAYGLRGLDVDEAAAPLEALLDRVEDNLRTKSARKSAPGRQIAGATEIAAMITREYAAHFGKVPGASKQEDTSNPFAAICRVVERLLADAGYSVTLGYEARVNALGRYKKKIKT